MVNDEVLRSIRGIIKTMNPAAKIIETSLNPSSKGSQTTHSPLNVKDILATGAYSEETSVKSSGWLKSIHDMFIMDNNGRKVFAPKPETIE